MTFTEDVAQRFTAYGWHVQRVDDGNDLAAIDAALSAAEAVADRPSLIAVRTHIGYGSPHKQDTAAAHGSPLGEEEVRLTKRALGWPEDAQFLVPEGALALYREVAARGAARRDDWLRRFAAYEAAYPELAVTWRQVDGRRAARGLGGRAARVGARERGRRHPLGVGRGPERARRRCSRR